MFFLNPDKIYHKSQNLFFLFLFQLMFTPRHMKQYAMTLVMALHETGRDVYSLPISASSVVPKISLLTPILDYGRCFLDYPKTLEAEFLNDSNLPVKYKVGTQEDKRVVIYSTPQPSGIIPAHSTLRLPLEIKPRLQGAMSMVVPVKILNSPDTIIPVGVTCIGEGPVVYVTPDTLKWGVCPVLTPITKIVTLANQSIIPAKFECALVSRHRKKKN